MSMGMWVNEGTPTMRFVLYTINVEYMCDASYVTWKYRQYGRYHVIFVRKYKTVQKINLPGARLSSSGTPFFRQYIFAILYVFIILCKSAWPFNKKETWILFTQGYFVPRLVEIDPVVLENKILKFCQCIFAIWYTWPFIWINFT